MRILFLSLIFMSSALAVEQGLLGDFVLEKNESKVFVYPSAKEADVQAEVAGLDQLAGVVLHFEADKMVFRSGDIAQEYSLKILDSEKRHDETHYAVVASSVMGKRFFMIRQIDPTTIYVTGDLPFLGGFIRKGK